MSELLPSIQADEIRDGIIEYLTTTFALADTDARVSLDEFLRHDEHGIFTGPYVRVRLPFRGAPEGAERALGWYEGNPPYGHQAAAFARLSSANLGAHKPRPLPTLVTTGTGSGKTEAFLYPILDHVLRAKAAGERGVKALILYPMNALANDQARRLTELLTTLPALAGVRAGIYTGDAGAKPRRTVTEAGLITDRHTMQADPPDVLLTNYKMLDQLLLRPADQPLWAQSATSLRYLVLDEFHTYDGAQGTDVAMLLRRLGLALKRHWADDDARIDAHARASVLGLVTPVATSATLGSGDDPSAMVAFANTVFGGGFDADAVVTETRLTLDEWVAGAESRVASRLESIAHARGGDATGGGDATSGAPLEAITDATSLIDALAACVDASDDAARPAHLVSAADAAHLAATVLAVAYGDEPAHASGPHGAFADAAPGDLLDAVKAHPVLRRLVDEARQPRPLDELAASVLPAVPAPGLALTSELAQAQLDERRHRAITLLLAALSHVRAVAGRAAATVELHQWVRAVTRLDRVAGPTAAYRWADDGATSLEDNDDAHSGVGRPAFPAVYCRHCGRSGWGVSLAPTGFGLAPDDADIRGNHARGEGRFRALLFAPAEADANEQRGPSDPPIEGLRWFDAVRRELAPERRGDEDGTGRADSNVLPVLALADDPHNDRSNNDECPSCGQADGIRFLGSAIATLLSVTVTTIFGDDALDAGEKKALVFTDSVQDAAHRAGFVQSRSHVFNLRNAMREAAGPGPVTLTDLVESMLSRADTAERRYRLLAPELVDRDEFRAFWREAGAEGSSTVAGGSSVASSSRAKTAVRRRLAFDLALEFGLHGGLGRTLLRTGSLAAWVDAGPRPRLEAIARGALRSFEGEATLDLPIEESAEDGALARWVRGVLEHVRERGGIAHPWFAKYVHENGARWPVWGGRPRGQGMPAFPPGRETPGYPRVGGASKLAGGHVSDLDAATSNQGWYARWAARTLGVSTFEGADLTRLLFAALAADDLVVPVAAGGGIVYQLDPSRVMVGPATTDADGRARQLRCETCENEIYGSADVLDQLLGGPCTSLRCSGRLADDWQPSNYYRRLYDEGEMRRVVAREHTGLVPDDERRAVEDGFKASATNADAPNVLVATPTLEMGIDIGDLSTVFLAGLPRSVASYLQRVGRAGRLTGNALIMAFVVGRGEQLHKLGDPLSVIGGEVRPPATYLNAEEILRRQYLAAIIDGLAARGEVGSLTSAIDVLGSDAPGSFVDTVIRDAEEHASERLAAFLSTFTGLDAWAAGALERWATPQGDGARSSELAGALIDASARWQHEVETLRHRKEAIRVTFDALETQAEHPAATDDDKAALRSARAGYRLVSRTLDELRRMHWVGALERAGLLPNYSLLDDRVRLDVGVSWIDPDTNEYESREASYERAASIAIAELAPGNVFYASGLEIEIDAIDLGSGAGDVQRWAFCPACGHGRTLDLPDADADAEAACPRCGSAGIADTAQVFDTIELEAVSAEVRRDESSIGDGRDERREKQYNVLVAVDLDERRVVAQWFVDGRGFGAKLYRDLTIRWINLGQQRGHSGGERTIAGTTLRSAPLFRVCEACGKLDARGDENTAREHRAWCPHRASRDEHVVALALTRTLVSQGLVLRLPPSITIGDTLALPSLIAALQAGLREAIGGDPDHLRIVPIQEPIGGVDGATAPALLVHDAVPGGTGYLVDLAATARMREVLEHAWRVVSSCSCASDGRSRLACHRCLLPYAPGGGVDLVSRASAAQHLGELLGVVDPASEPAAIGTPWVVSTVDPGVDDPESHLEHWFRKVFTERAEAAGASVTEQPGAWGNHVRVTFPGGGAWRLTPQLPIGGVRPDFVLEPVGSGKGGVPSIAIFTDGWRYHASATHNRLADDAQKRASLRERGYHVLAVTWRDVEAAGAAEPGSRAHDRSGGADDVSGWFDRRASAVIAASRGLNSSDLDVIEANPITLLFRWMQDATTAHARWCKLADELPKLLAPSSRFLDPGTGAGAVERRTREALDGRYADAVGGSQMYQLRRGALVATVQVSSDATLSTRTVVALDDRAAAIESSGAVDHHAAWRLWLRLSNLLGFATPHRRAELTTASLLGDVAVDVGPVAAPHGGGTEEDRGAVAEQATTPATVGPIDFEPTGAWLVLVDHSLSDAERGLLTALAARGGIDVPAQGIEVLDGIPVTLAWPGRRIVVDLDLDDTDREELSEGGWKIVSVDVDAIAVALEGSA